MKRDYPLTLFAWCFVVLVASFMPWGNVGAIYIPLLRANVGQSVTGWTGYITVAGVLIPNWILVVIAAALVFISWLRSNSIFVQPKLPYWLTVYGIAHAAVFVFGTLFSYGGTGLGIGSLATLAAFIGILRTSPKVAIESAPPHPVVSGPVPPAGTPSSSETYPEPTRD